MFYVAKMLHLFLSMRILFETSVVVYQSKFWGFSLSPFGMAISIDYEVSPINYVHT